MFTKTGIYRQTSPKLQDIDNNRKTHYAVLEFLNVDRMMDRQADIQTGRKGKKAKKSLRPISTILLCEQCNFTIDLIINYIFDKETSLT
jgi:hypothetical protein